MANKDVLCQAGQWTLLTNTDVTAIRVQNPGERTILLMATATASEPQDNAGSVRLYPQSILLPDTDLASLFPGVSNAARVYAYSTYTTVISVSHA